MIGVDGVRRKGLANEGGWLRRIRGRQRLTFGGEKVRVDLSGPEARVLEDAQ